MVEVMFAIRKDKFKVRFHNLFLYMLLYLVYHSTYEYDYVLINLTQRVKQ
jgi:hypothetical protein